MNTSLIRRLRAAAQFLDTTAPLLEEAAREIERLYRELEDESSTEESDECL